MENNYEDSIESYSVNNFTAYFLVKCRATNIGLYH